jgi:4-hydroxybenzoate polyprenyltransferase/phosphoserine phosphatase
LSTLPLVVDLDGTLINTDMLHESALKLLGKNPLNTFKLPYWLSQGKAALKGKLADRTDIDPSTLPYNPKLLSWLKEQQKSGRQLILCTASHTRFATAIAKHLNIFDDVIASDNKTNLSGENKAQLLEQRFGQAGFDYAGNAKADIAVWKRARRGIVVNASARLTQEAQQCCEVEETFPANKPTLAIYRKVLRIHQWLKNSLLFIPIFAAHQLTNSETWLALFFAFFSFSLCASSVYITNDLLDLESDRQHPQKCKRPFASGMVPAWIGVVLAPLLLLTSFGLASYVGGAFFKGLMVYFGLTCAYSWGLKRIILVDCLTLAVLYTLRIIAGAAAASMGLSFWLLAFSVFLFLSLAFIKRYAELEVQLLHGKHKIHGRGYYTTDAPLIQTLGISAGYAAVLVMALYLNSDAVVKLYKTAEFVWGTVPVLLFWISWMWMQAHRGKMHDDPLVFAVKDKASLLAGIAFAATLIMGTMDWQW